MTAKNPAYRPRDGEARSVTESRLLGFLKFHQFTYRSYAEGARNNTLRVIDYAGFYICRAAQLWQLQPASFAVVWIDVAADGVATFTTLGDASEKFMQVRAALGRKPAPSVVGPNNQRSDELEEEDEDEWSQKLRTSMKTSARPR